MQYNIPGMFKAINASRLSLFLLQNEISIDKQKADIKNQIEFHHEDVFATKDIFIQMYPIIVTKIEKIDNILFFISFVSFVIV